MVPLNFKEFLESKNRDGSTLLEGPKSCCFRVDTELSINTVEICLPKGQSVCDGCNDSECECNYEYVIDGLNGTISRWKFPLRPLLTEEFPSESLVSEKEIILTWGKNEDELRYSKVAMRMGTDVQSFKNAIRRQQISSSSVDWMKPDTSGRFGHNHGRRVWQANILPSKSDGLFSFLPNSFFPPGGLLPAVSSKICGWRHALTRNFVETKEALALLF